MVGGMSAAGVEIMATQVEVLPWCERLMSRREKRVSAAG